MNRRRVRGVSTLIATLMLIGIVAAMGSFVYWYAVAYAKSASKIAAIAIVEAKVSKVGNNTNVLVTIRNQGTISVELKDVMIYDDSGQPRDLLDLPGTILSPNVKTLKPGDSITAVYIGGALSLTPGKSYTIVVVTDQGAQQISTECMYA